MIALITFATAAIAFIAIAACMMLLDQRAKLRDRVAELEFRERKLSDHCVTLLHGKRRAEAELAAANRYAVPRWGVSKGVA